jgi:pilus assembly protein CpaC
VVVGDPAIASAVPTNTRSFYILGRTLGRTNVAIHDPNDTLVGMLEVEVNGDTPDLAESIREAIPKANVRVESVNGRTRLSGAVPDAIALRRVLEIAAQYGDNVVNALRVTGGQQVMLEVRFVEANRTAARELGVRLRVAALDNSIGFQSGRDSPTSGAPFGTFVAQVLGAGVRADILIQALEEKRLGRRLAEPNLVALSGDTASFLAGGEVPYNVPQSNGNPPAIAFKEFGVRLNFTPTVLDNGLINLKLEPEVSEVASFTGSGVPVLSTRRANTTIEVRDGQSFAIAGLLQSNHTKTQDQLPWIGQLPILGALFRSSAFREEETDLVIIVTPRLVQPTKPGRPLKTPLDQAKGSNDVEFFLLGALEVDQKTIDQVQSNAGVIGPHGHIVDLPPVKAVKAAPKPAPVSKPQVTK